MPSSAELNRERERRRRQRTQQIHLAAPVPPPPPLWWDNLHLHPPPPIVPATWNRRCHHCNALLLSTERNSFCCADGRHALPPLHPLPPRMRALLRDEQHARHLMDYSRVVNNLFSFAGIGVTGSFQQFASGAGIGPPAVAITGRTYHLLRDTEYADHSIHWFLYDESERVRKATQFNAHSFVVQAIADDLRNINPYVHHLHHFHSVPRRHSRLLELQDFSSNSDFAAVMHASNSTSINPRSIIVRRHASGKTSIRTTTQM